MALGVTDLQKKLYTELSAGQKRRLHLTLALIGKPDILFLDEPTTELDVEGRISLHNEIRKLNQMVQQLFCLVMIWQRLKLFVPVSLF